MIHDYKFGKAPLRSFLSVLLFFSFLSLQASSFIGGRTDFRDETIYFVMTTRFYDGDPSNNTHCWDGSNPGDPAWRGDFKGLIEKLDYIKALGFTAIWITPVVENASGYDYHGYHAMNLKKVDQRYESEDVDFQDLIDAIHAKDMKIILDVVFNHTGNFGENTLCPMFVKEGDLGSIDCMKRHPDSRLPENYDDLIPSAQYQARLALMKNTDGQNHDTNNYWHHFGHFNHDDMTAQWGQIAGDCVDLNTENPAVYNYIIEAYSKFIKMGVDGFRIDTGRHISRLVFNKVFNDAFHEAARKAGNPNFYMFGEICTRVRDVWNRGHAANSTPFYTWKDSKSYPWSDDAAPYSNIAIFESNFDAAAQSLTNQKSCIDMYNQNNDVNQQPTSTNAFLTGNDYTAPDYSMHSGLNVIDFPMHWNFEDAGSAFRVAKSGDKYYNDASWNVVYVDSHDYAPDGAPEGQRFAKDQSVWAENLALMYTFRGIPCLYYGSEVEFKKGKTIDEGTNIKLIDSGRAYYGGYITGDINVNDFADYSNVTGNMAVSLQHPLAQHIQRLSKIRMTVPALRKGQYSTDNISGTELAFKRRYTDDTTDSFVLVAISGSATFSSIPAGTYTDVITGDVKTVSAGGTLTATVSGKGNLRAYVLATSKTPSPGKIGTDGKYLYTSSSVTPTQGSYDGQQDALTENEGGNGGGEGEEPIEPILYEGEQAIFFEKGSDWGTDIKAYVYYNTSSGVTEVNGAWRGAKMTSLGNGIYKFIFNETIGNDWYILFNDGSRQAPNDVGFTVVNGGYYTASGLDHVLQPTSVTNITNATITGITVYSKDQNIYIESQEEKFIQVIGVDGKIVRETTITKGTNIIPNIEKGLYIVDRKKVIVY